MIQQDSVSTTDSLCPAAQEILADSLQHWGVKQAVEIIGLSSKIRDALEKVRKFGRFNQTILITGESGVGKELFARACYLFGNRTNGPFVVANCPQYNEGNLVVSELFGHTKGSFTGATADHKGLFETAQSGIIFLDEVGDLHPAAQTMLLRALAEKEIKALGASLPKSLDVRVIAATNRPLRKMIGSGEFREDLYFRLRYFPLDIPPLRERGDDWKLLIEFFVKKFNQEHGIQRVFSPTAFRYLERYSWPGNIRELRSLVTVGYSMADGKFIESEHFAAEIEANNLPLPPTGQDELLDSMLKGGSSFWKVVQEPFLDRELNRSQVRQIVAQGLSATRGSYRRLSEAFNIEPEQYHKFMDFLRHHRLKPDD
jgi:transcriptional regulator with GAF, ATPase, and Fis domain